MHINLIWGIHLVFSTDLHDFGDPSSFVFIPPGCRADESSCFSSFLCLHQILMVWKQILRCPRKVLLKGILCRSKAFACKVNNHLLIDLVYEGVYWVSVSSTHTVGVAPHRFPWQPHLVWKKLGGIAYTPRKGETKLSSVPYPNFSLPSSFVFVFP